MCQQNTVQLMEEIGEGRRGGGGGGRGGCPGR